MKRKIWLATAAVLFFTFLGMLVDLAPAAADYSAERWEYRRDIQGRIAVGQKYAQALVDGQIYTHSQAGSLADLRIIKTGPGPEVEVPYVLYSDPVANEEKTYLSTILNNSFVPGEYSSFVVDLGSSGQTNNRLEIETSSANFLRRVELEGTDSLSSPWNKLDTADHIFDYGRNRSTLIHYSENAFRYLRVRIWNKTEKPLNITGARVFYDARVKAAEQQLVPDLISSVEERDKQVTVLTFDTHYANFPTHRLLLKIAGENFSRQVAVEAGNELNNWNQAGAGSQIYSYNIDNKVGQNLAVDYPEVYGRYLRVTIYNQDNPPLKVTGATADSLVRKVIFPVESGGSYRLVYGNPQAQLPRYDLQQLAAYMDKSSLSVLALGSEVKNPGYAGEKRPWTEENQWVLWLTLILAVIVLGSVIINSMRRLNSD